MNGTSTLHFAEVAPPPAQTARPRIIIVRRPAVQPVAAPVPQPESIQEHFEQFHQKHPEVYQELVRLARFAKSKGFEKIGIALLWERLRWYVMVERHGEDFKLSNNYRSRYARLIMEREADLRGFFTTRELRTA